MAVMTYPSWYWFSFLRCMQPAVVFTGQSQRLLLVRLLAFLSNPYIIAERRRQRRCQWNEEKRALQHRRKSKEDSCRWLFLQEQVCWRSDSWIQKGYPTNESTYYCCFVWKRKAFSLLIWQETGAGRCGSRLLKRLAPKPNPNRR